MTRTKDLQCLSATSDCIAQPSQPFRSPCHPATALLIPSTACLAAGARVKVFDHNTPAHLEALLRAAIAEGQPRTGRPWKKVSAAAGWLMVCWLAWLAGWLAGWLAAAALGGFRDVVWV